MPTHRHRFRISEKRRRADFGKAKRRPKRNGFPKPTRSSGSKEALKPTRKVNERATTGDRSALASMTGSAACYIHGSGEEQRGTQLYHKKKTLGDARERCRDCNAQWQSRVLEYAASLAAKLTTKDHKRLEAALGYRGYSGAVRASDLPAKQKFGFVCADVVHSYALALPNLRWFHITLFGDEFRVSERHPALALKKLKSKAYKELHELGLSGLAWIDVDPLPNYSESGKGGSFMFHVHVVAFTDRDFDVDQARQKLKRSRRWSCCLRAEPTDIREITQRMGTPAWWAIYGAKPPYRAKRRVLQADGTSRLRWTDQGYRPQIAMRLAEGLAQLALMDTFFAIGEGKDLREDVRRRLAAWHRKRWPDQRRRDVGSTGSLFKRLWAVTRVKAYNRWRIIGATV